MPMSSVRRILPRRWADRGWWALVLLAFFAFVWQVADRQPAFVVNHRQVINPIVAAGDVLEIAYAGKQNWQGENKVYRRIYDGAGVVWPYLTEENPPRPLKPNYTSRVRIPPAATPGPSTMVVTVCWERQFNFIHQMWPVCPPSGEFSFEIVKPN